jgi:hypothetical protein
MPSFDGLPELPPEWEHMRPADRGREAQAAMVNPALIHALRQSAEEGFDQMLGGSDPVSRETGRLKYLAASSIWSGLRRLVGEGITHS